MTDDVQARIARLERRLERERRVRIEAEARNEHGLRELYEREQHMRLLAEVSAKANHERSLATVFAFLIDQVLARSGWLAGRAVFRDTIDQADITRENPGKPFALPSEVACPVPETLEMEAPRIAEPIGCEVVDDRGAVATHRSSFCVVGTEGVLAVIEFFHSKRTAPQEAFCSILGQVCAQAARVIERKTLEERLLHNALHDPLTGIANRDLFHDRLETVVRRTRAPGPFGYTLIFIDLDRFKAINDTHGHAIGDRLLVAVVDRLKECVSAFEATGDVTLARLGGDEFGLLVDRMDETVGGLELGRAVVDVLSEPFTIASTTLGIGASVGLTGARMAYRRSDEAVRDADTAMYVAKRSGPSRIALFDETMRREAETREYLENNLDQALAAGEFYMVYQPIIRLDSSAIVGFEALMRWTRADGMEVSPAIFIPLAEETGAIVALGPFALSTALDQMAAWSRDGARPLDLTMSVNVSAAQITQKDFAAIVQAELTRTAIPAANLHLEVTESLDVGGNEAALETLANLRETGVHISLDDFGTGYSGFGYANELPFDTLKIDRSFMQHLDTDRESIIDAVLALGRALDVNVIAEGAETSHQIDRLRALACETAQGFYFSKAVTAAEASLFLKNSCDDAVVASDGALCSGAAL